jgi:hypothetical protein
MSLLSDLPANANRQPFLQWEDSCYYTHTLTFNRYASDTGFQGGEDDPVIDERSVLWETWVVVIENGQPVRERTGCNLLEAEQFHAMLPYLLEFFGKPPKNRARGKKK